LIDPEPRVIMAEAPTPSAIEQRQLDKLRKLLRAVHSSNRFYQGKFRGIDTEIESLADFSSRVPFTAKSEIVLDQSAAPPFGNNLTFPLDHYSRFHQTSGSKGTPLRWLDTEQNWRAMLHHWGIIFDAANVGATDRICFAFSFGPFIGFWLAFEAACKLGALCIPGGGLSSKARIRLILENEATVLCCTPTYALRLKEVADQENIDLKGSKVRLIIVAGEPGGSVPATRQRIEAAWPGARVFDHHGMTEVGPVTYECPRHPGRLHLIESAFFAEVIDPQNGASKTEGELGELVLTTLERIGSPLIRYRTGDLVRSNRSTLCDCGRSDLLLEGGILGRTDDMLVVRGVNVYPSAIEEIINSTGEIAEYRVNVFRGKALNELTILVEPMCDCKNPPEAAARLADLLHAKLALRIPVSLAPEPLPRFEMKAQRWVTID
jgi:phenylacetate-CoA ligase